MIRLTIPSIEEDDLAAVRQVLETGYLVQGPRVAEFEGAIAAYVGVEHAIAVSNCTAALHLTLLALGVEKGDRVAVATYSWPATANVILLCGAEPVFVDIDRATYNMSPDALARTLERNNVKAVLPVHTFGGMADMRRLAAIAARHGVPLLEDAACALGAEFEGRRAGAWGIAGCFSFHPRKSITTGEGGVVATNDAALARRIRTLRNHGLDPAAAAPDFVEAGYNLRMTEFQAALGASQMKKLERITERRRTAAAVYDEILAQSGITPPASLPGARHVYQSYVALLPAEAAPKRAEIMARMKEESIEVAIGTYHIPLTSYFRRSGYKAGDFPITDDIAARAVTLPLFEAITANQQAKVVRVLKRQIYHDERNTPKCGAGPELESA
jgi:dTDP-4-amino-4,6-dideoxygalactose transaminase